MHSNKGTLAGGAPQQINRARSNVPSTNPPPSQKRNQRPAASQGRGDKDAAKGRKTVQARAHKQELTDDDFDCEYDDELEDVDAEGNLAASTSTDSLRDAKLLHGRENRMSDLPMKVQKPKGDDFVMISDVNRVVALEDSTNQLEGPGVDGWEYIPRGEQQELAVSYAQAVATPNNK